MAKASYDPKATTVVPNYVVKTAGDRFFIPGYPNPHTKTGDLASCKALSPKGVEKVALLRAPLVLWPNGIHQHSKLYND